MLRLAFNRSSWRPEGEESGEEFRFLLSCLPADEAEKVGRFKFFADKQRALASRLLQVRDTTERVRERVRERESVRTEWIFGVVFRFARV